MKLWITDQKIINEINSNLKFQQQQNRDGLHSYKKKNILE